MSSITRQKKLPSRKYDQNIQINLTLKQREKLDRLCKQLEISYSEYFRERLAKDKTWIT